MKRFSILLIGFVFVWVLGYREAYACRIVPTIHPPIPITQQPPQLQPIQVRNHLVTTTIKNGVAVTTLETVFF